MVEWKTHRLEGSARKHKSSSLFSGTKFCGCGGTEDTLSSEGSAKAYRFKSGHPHQVLHSWRNGSRAGLRNQFLREWEFESPRVHQVVPLWRNRKTHCSQKAALYACRFDPGQRHQMGEPKLENHPMILDISCKDFFESFFLRWFLDELKASEAGEDDNRWISSWLFFRSHSFPR